MWGFLDYLYLTDPLTHLPSDGAMLVDLQSCDPDDL